jgi:hypothetical protein
MCSAEPAASFFIAHEPSLQQPSSQHEAAESLAAPSFFIGHESPEQQQHDIAVSATALLLYAIPAAASPRTSSTEIASINLFIFLPRIYKPSTIAGVLHGTNKQQCRLISKYEERGSL